MVSHSIKLDKFVYLSEPKNEKELEEKQYFLINLRAKFWLQVVHVLQFKGKKKRKGGGRGARKGKCKLNPRSIKAGKPTASSNVPGSVWHQDAEQH